MKMISKGKEKGRISSRSSRRPEVTQLLAMSMDWIDGPGRAINSPETSSSRPSKHNDSRLGALLAVGGVW